MRQAMAGVVMVQGGHEAVFGLERDRIAARQLRVQGLAIHTAFSARVSSAPSVGSP